MNKLLISVKRFLGNKNTVTIIGVLAGCVVLYIGYQWRVKQAVEPTQVPYAKEEIAANTLITSDMVGTIKVSKSMVDQTSNLVTSKVQVIGKYVSYDTTIPEGSLFYKTQLKSSEQMPNYITENIPECYTVYSLSVDLHSTYANAIMPGDYIDLYISAKNDDGQIIISKLVEKIQVSDVRDSKGISVFSSASTSKTPSEIIFTVSNSMFKLLKIAENISSNSINIFPVPRNSEYSVETGYTIVASDAIKEFIESKADPSYAFSTSEYDLACEAKEAAEAASQNEQ